MFSHESIPLISLFIILLLCVLGAVLHPIHALRGWVLRRRNKSNARTQSK